MLKYFIIAKNTLQVYFTYRLSFLFWRLQIVISFLIFYYLWSAVAVGKQFLGSYTIPQIYSYFVIGYIIRALVFTTRTGDIGGDIQTGELTSLLLKPIGIIKYYFSRDLSDKLFNLVFMLVEFSLLLLFLRPQLIAPTLPDFLLFLASLLIAVVLFFFYSLIISFLTFWTETAWSSRFLFGVVFINLFSGQYLPLDLLPRPIFHLLNYTPFPYLYYYPVRFWLGKETGPQAFFILLISFLILVFFYLLAHFLWVRGKLRYQAYGN
jgi:ABC-2 type transport system permease protein